MASVIDVDDEDNLVGLNNAVDDAVVTAAITVQALEFVAELLTQPRRIVRE